jgi:DNA polymerase III epsilon subunit-like protein
MKIIWLDTETSGLSPERNDIIQLAAIAEIDGKVVGEFEGKCRPFDPHAVEEEAIKTHGHNLEEIIKWPDPNELKCSFCAFMAQHVDKFNKLDKFIPAGQNPQFDINFIQHFFLKNKDVYW